MHESMSLNFRRLAPLLVTLGLAVACGPGDDDTAATAAMTTTSPSPTSPGSSSGDEGSETGGSSGGDDTSTTGGTTGDATTGDATTAAPTTTPTTTGSSGDATTMSEPPEGPGVFPGESGLEAFCRRYVECGGTYYEDAQGCIDASYDYWGDCPSRKAALDVFGACMAEVACDDWNPDAYNPANTSCAAEWEGVGDSDPCD